MTQADVRIIRCPACGGPSRYASDNRYRPFCCERCRNLDLGAWASETYRVGSKPSQDPDEDGERQDPGH